MPKLLRITTIPISLNVLLKGQLAYMRRNGFEVITASADGPEVAQLSKREGVKHFKIDFTRTLSPFKDLKALFQLIKLIRSEKPDIVHTHTPKAGLLGMLAASFCRVKIRLHTVAGMPLMEATGSLKHILGFTEAVTYSFAMKVYPNSYQLKAWMEQNFERYSSKFKVIAQGSSNGISVSYFNPEAVGDEDIKEVKAQYGIQEGVFTFVFVGRLVSDKGIHELIEAFLSLKNQCQLIIVGAYEDEREPINENTKRLIADSGNIFHVGFQSDIRPFLSLSDVFVFPSYREGFPNVVLQAAAMGLPSIVSNINGNNEIIKEEENGLIVAVKASDKLAGAMERITSDHALRKKLAENSRKSVEEKYEQEYVWSELYKEYQLLLNSY